MRSATGLAGLRLLILGGEAVPAVALTAWRRLAPHVTVVNAYVPTDATVTSTAHVVTGTDERARVPIGHALGGRRRRDGAHPGCDQREGSAG